MKLQNQPNAAKLISSLRNTGYDSYAAVEDIIDNSIDAHARTIKVLVGINDKTPQIIISDNGTGMNKTILDEALKLGSQTDKDNVSDLGKYGMGLCTASISMARRLEVITKEKDGELLYSSQDLDDVIDENSFIKVFRPASKEENKLFSNLVSGDNGTVVVLSKIDRISDSNVGQFSNKLSRDLGRIYRKFIESGIEFFVNDKKVELNDPLMPDNSETQVYSDETYDLPQKSVNGRSEQIRVKIVILPEVNSELEKEYKMNIRTQGFYVLRNNREIAWGSTLDIFSKHNDFNRLRMELYFSSSLDNEMGVRFSKDGISPSQAITDFLKQEVGGQIASIRKILLKKKKSDESSKIDHTASESVIAQKAKLLVTPDAIIEKRASRKKNTDEHEKPEPSGDVKDRVDIKKTKTSPKGIGARFESFAMGREGTLYDCYQEGKIIVVRWNTDHPFYDRVLLANKADKNITSALDYLVFALASAELKVENDENTELISNIKTVMSINLRALLS